jgi:hypothetical protein
MTMLYLVTEEDDDGMWFGEPKGFSSESEAREWLDKRPQATEGYNWVLYRCTEMRFIREPACL